MNFTAKGPFQPLHLLFLGAFLLIFAVTILTMKKNRNMDRYMRIVRVLSVIQVVFVIIRRITSTMTHIEAFPMEYSWLSVLPDSCCSFTSLGLALVILFGKKNNRALHFFAYLALFGGVTSTIYPDYLYKESIFELSTIVGLLYHALDIWLVFVLIVCGWFVPSVKKLPCFVIGYAGMMLFGVLEVFVLGYPDAMNVRNALVTDLPAPTSWYALCVESMVCILIISSLYVGVILGPDIVFENGEIKTIYGKTHSVSGPNADRYIRNIYRVLMSRGKKGCFIFCYDKALNEHFKNLLEKAKQ